MATFKLTLAYDGTRFVGWQRQGAGTSIQGLVEDALGDLDGRPVVVIGAGRTDAGVHALGQVASCRVQRAVEPAVLARALNARLPAAVRVVSAEVVAAGFHARFDSTAKTYRYRICNTPVMSPFDRKYAWHVTGALDVETMDAAARVLEGRHDFKAFQATGGGSRRTERTVTRSRVLRVPVPAPGDVVASDDGALIVCEITGEGFLRHMVRAVVGTLVEIGRGRWPSERMCEILTSCDRRQAGPTAPARGLFLVGVEYRDL